MLIETALKLADCVCTEDGRRQDPVVGDPDRECVSTDTGDCLGLGLTPMASGQAPWVSSRIPGRGSVVKFQRVQWRLAKPHGCPWGHVMGVLSYPRLWVCCKISTGQDPTSREASGIPRPCHRVIVGNGVKAVSGT